MSENSQEKEVKPPLDEKEQSPPGHESKMKIAPDYGEKNYRSAENRKAKRQLSPAKFSA